MLDFQKATRKSKRKKFQFSASFNSSNFLVSTFLCIYRDEEKKEKTVDSGRSKKWSNYYYFYYYYRFPRGNTKIDQGKSFNFLLLLILLIFSTFIRIYREEKREKTRGRSKKWSNYISKRQHENRSKKKFLLLLILLIFSTFLRIYREEKREKTRNKKGSNYYY